MNDLYEEDLALEEMENLKAKTEMYKKATWLMNIIGIILIISSVAFLVTFLTVAGNLLKIIN